MPSEKELAPRRNRGKARVFEGEWPPAPGRSVVIKDISGMALPLRLIYGRPQLRREWRALEALAGLDCVPAPVARPNLDRIVMGRCDGVRLDTLEQGHWYEDEARQLEALLAEIGERGITHGDLHRKNILRSPEGRIFVIDWATAHVYGTRRSPFKNWTYGEFRALDRRAVAKVKFHIARGLLTTAERDLLINGASAGYRLVKRVRLLVRKALGLREQPAIDFTA